MDILFRSFVRSFGRFVIIVCLTSSRAISFAISIERMNCHSMHKALKHTIWCDIVEYRWQLYYILFIYENHSFIGKQQQQPNYANIKTCVSNKSKNKKVSKEFCQMLSKSDGNFKMGSIKICSQFNGQLNTFENFSISTIKCTTESVRNTRTAP